MHQVFTHFKTLTKIPHCSYHAEALKRYLIEFAQKHGYEVQTDTSGNILASKKGARLILQAHYDMVCVGRAPDIEIVTKEGWMYANDSTLGADNGIAIAMMMSLMQEGVVCEFLFTADEEVGLLGAKALAFELQGSYLLNLDSEDEAEVYIGCAGGMDIFAKREYLVSAGENRCYEVVVSGLPGGHSGVEIHKDIPNAIKVFAEYAQTHKLQIVQLEAGERINSIPVHVRAIVSCAQELSDTENIRVQSLTQNYPVIKESDVLVASLLQIPHGVLAWNESLQIPDRSANLALASIQEGVCEIAVSIRAMDAKGLAATEKEVMECLQSFGYEIHSDGKYPAWKPEINDFSRLVYRSLQNVFGDCRYKAIHAGLECAVLSDLYPDIQIASVGPNIRSPHSTHESVEIASVEKTYQAVRMIVKEVCGV